MINFPHFKVLSAQEEYEVATRPAQGDKSARSILILSNIPFAIVCSKKFSRGDLDADDLIEESIVGLVRAVDKFDVTKGLRFITYTKFWIVNEIENALGKRKKQMTHEKHFSTNKDNDFDGESFFSLASLSCGNPLSSDVEDECINQDVAAKVRDAVDSLEPRKADVVRRHYGLGGCEPESFSQIAAREGLTKARMDQIEKEAFCFLRLALAEVS